MTAVDTTRRDFAFSVLGGPTTVIDVAGRRLVIDPTFDAPGEHGHLTKTAAAAVSASALGPVDAVLISHDEHADNLDDDGRRFALSAPMIITHPGAARRLGPQARGLDPWQAVELPTGRRQACGVDPGGAGRARPGGRRARRDRKCDV